MCFSARIAALLIPLIAGCATFPLLEATPEQAVEQAAYPVLMPIDALLASVPPAPETNPQAELDARAAALRARAAALRNSDISG